jgi:hypothetical protein
MMFPELRHKIYGTTPASFAAAPVAHAGARTRSGVVGVAGRAELEDPRATHRLIARSIPAVRKAEHVIAGTISTFALTAWASDTERLDPTDPRCAWMRQPDPERTLQRLLFGTIDDLIWLDRSVWRVLDRNAALMPVKFRRVPSDQVDTVSDPLDPERVTTWIINGHDVPRRDLVVFDAGGLGGLRRFGTALLDLYLDLQAAAGRYARAPHPQAVLKNSGGDLDDTEIQVLLDEWEAAREVRAVGYLNQVVDYQTFGWDAAQLQLTEGREYAALEVARLFGLPARAVDATTGDSMTYANVVEARRDILEAIRPWITVLEQTLSLDDRSSRPTGLVLPYGISCVIDTEDYLREAPGARMTTWETALRAGVLTLPEVRAAEPLAVTEQAPAPADPDPPPVPAPTDQEATV